MDEMLEPIETESEASDVSANNYVTKALQSPLFMTVALLVTIAFGFDIIVNLFTQGVLVPDVILLLLLIGLWITRSCSKSTLLTDSVSVAGMNLVSGTVKAVRIIALVISILCFFAAAGFVVMIPVVNANPQIAEEYMGETQAALYILLRQSFSQFDTPSMATAFSICAAAASLICGLLFLIPGYYLFLKKAHRFTYELCENMKHGTAITNAKALANWTMVIGILLGIFALTAGFAILSLGTLSAAVIVASCWLRKHFVLS